MKIRKTKRNAKNNEIIHTGVKIVIIEAEY